MEGRAALSVALQIMPPRRCPAHRAPRVRDGARRGPRAAWLIVPLWGVWRFVLLLQCSPFVRNAVRHWFVVPSIPAIHSFRCRAVLRRGSCVSGHADRGAQRRGPERGESPEEAESKMRLESNIV